MAIGAMAAAPQHDFVAYVEQRPQRSVQTRRAVIVSGALAAAMCIAVVMTGSSHPRTELMGIAGGMPLAETLLRNTDAPVEHLAAALQSWQDQQISDFDSPDAQMLAGVPANVETVLEDSGKLCAKKDIIFEKFNQLLKKLGDEQVARNETDKKLYDAKQAANMAWLDAESDYRLQEEKVKEAGQGAKYAREQFEKWSATVAGTQKRLDKMNKDYEKELADIGLERQLIKEILHLLGIMEDQPLDDASKKAGGYVKKEAETKASPLTLSEVRAKLAILKEKAQQRDSPIDLHQVDALQSKLASFAESDAVKKLLSEMLDALAQREKIIKRALKETKDELEKHTAQAVKFEKQVVDLSAAGDKAQQATDAADLTRNRLDGKAVNAKEEYKTEHGEYVIVSPPAERAMVIIKTIMKKVTEFCNAKTS